MSQEMPPSRNKPKDKHDKMSAAEFFQMEMESEQPLIEIQVAEGLRGNGQIVQVVQENRLTIDRQKSACAEDEQNDKDSDSSDEEEQPKNMMEVDFDALIKNKTEKQLTDIASSLTRQYTHKDFPSKASKLLKRLERIWKKGEKQAEKAKDGKCGKCKKAKNGELSGLCKSCRSSIKYYRKKLDPSSYKECADCQKARFIYCNKRCQSCYEKDRKKRKSDALKKASKRSKSPNLSNRPQSLKCVSCSETITEGSQMDNTCSDCFDKFLRADFALKHQTRSA